MFVAGSSVWNWPRLRLDRFARTPLRYGFMARSARDFGPNLLVGAGTPRAICPLLSRPDHIVGAVARKQLYAFLSMLFP
jgi:hypothetical protein